MDERKRPHPQVLRALARRRFLSQAAAGTAVTVLGGTYLLSEQEAHAGEREDGRPRVPPGQRVLTKLKPMGGVEGDPSRAKWKLRVHGEVEAPFEIDFRELLGMDQVEQSLDVHCVTGWSVLGARWSGVRVKTLAQRAKLKSGARHVIFQAAHGYTANVRIDEALGDDVMIAHKLDGKPIARTHGAPVRGIVPDLYFWKSAKWITGIKFVRRDAPGYWEQRGYHNHADPWLEERHAPWAAPFMR